MQVVRELRNARIRLDEAVGELERMRGREADSLDPGYGRDVMDQRREIDERAIRHGAGIRVHILAEERDLADALSRQLPHLIEHRVERPADLIAPRVGNDAEAAVFAA